MEDRHEITRKDLDPRSRSGRIMDAVEPGETFVVTRNHTPIDELIPRRRHRTVTREEFAALSANAPVIDEAAFRAETDAAVDGVIRDPCA